MYNIVGKYIKKCAIIGFKLEDSDKAETIKVNKSDFVKLTKKGAVKGFRIENYGEVEYILGDNYGISEVKTLYMDGKMSIVDRIIENSRVVGYKVYNEREKKMLNISLSKAWEFAFDGSLSGARAMFKEENGRKQRVLVVDNFEDIPNG